MGPICANMIIVVADLLNYRNLYHALNVSASFHSRACPSFVNNVLFFPERNRVLSSKLVEMSFPNALVTESKKIIYWRSIGVIVFFEVNHLYCDENSAAITEIFVT